MFRNPAHKTAVHEAGHAVATIHLDIPFEGIELRIDAADGHWYCGGRLKGAELPDLADNERLWAQLIVIMAGYAGTSVFEHETAFSLREFTCVDDRDYSAAVDILRQFQPPVVEPTVLHTAMEQAWNDARQLIIANRTTLATISDELMRRSHPNGETLACHIMLTQQDLSRLLPSNR